ncbi:MASE1 domain-containing protein [Pseudooceanicola lipolyticus]|nr:MASE1 domain-containing protein [Pseudooceanicola lipolyticus]
MAIRFASGMPAGIGLIACYLAYMLAAAFGHWMMVLPDIPITVWPPNGVILAALLIQPRQSWPWWLAVGVAGELTSNVLWFANPLIWALGYVAANVAAVTVAALLLSRFLGAPIRRLATLQQVLAFLGLGVLVSPMVSATMGSALNAGIGKGSFVATWPMWWLGDATGILIATPLIISLVNAWRDRARPAPVQFLEGAMIGLVLAGLSAWEMGTGAAHAFLLPLPVIWAALRFEFRGATLAVLGLSLAIGLHANSMGAVQGLVGDLTTLHTRLQALIIVAAATGLIVAAITRQQRQALADLARSNTELEARVAERTRAIEAAEKRFKATFQNAGVGISIVSGDGKLMRVNERLARMLGYDAEEMEGRALDQFTHVDDLALGAAAWERLKSGAADEYELEKRYLRKDGVYVWGHTTVSCVRHPSGRMAYLIKIIQDITERRHSEELRQNLAREINHRSKNLLTIIQVIARQTASRSPQDFVQTFGDRLRALAANQDLLVKSEWQRISLHDLVHSQVEQFYATGNRIVVTGAPMMLPPAAAQAVGMALHELATNAAKYGSLSTETGQVHIAWEVVQDRFVMTWRETGGPEVTAPSALGFGTTLLDSMTASSLSGEVSIDYARDGLVWQLQCPLSALEDGAGDDGSGGHGQTGP